MKINAIAEHVFAAASTGNWESIPRDPGLIVLRDAKGDTLLHVAAKAGVAHKAPLYLWRGSHQLDRSGKAALDYLNPEDRRLMELRVRVGQLRQALDEQVPELN